MMVVVLNYSVDSGVSPVGAAGPCEDVSTGTQSVPPVLLFRGVEKLVVPVFGNGDPLTVVNVPSVGSIHRAKMGPLKLR